MQRKLLGIIRSTTDQIFCIRKILERKWKYNTAVHQLFTDFKKAYGSVRREVLYYVLIEFCIAKKLVRLKTIFQKETYSTFQVGKHLSDMFPVRKGFKQDALTPLLFNFASVYAIRRVQVIHDNLKFNGTLQVLVCADDVNILPGSVYTIQTHRSFVSQ
jgi:hypothetical protein